MKTYIYQNYKIEILYEDNDLAILNKPYGLLTHKKNEADAEPNLCDSLRSYFTIDDNELFKEGIVHRLDKNTSGIIIIAKNLKIKLELKKLFKARSINKYYLTYVLGNFFNKDKNIIGKITRQEKQRTKFKVSDNIGKDSMTKIKHLETFYGSISLLECKIITGRTHQIRVHLSEIGYPIIGDKDYHKNLEQKFALKNLPVSIKEFVNNFPRQALHSYKISFIHPFLNKIIDITCKLPIDLILLEKKLRNEE
ncbi:MAG: hypothetical protein CMI90_06560 [Pelagibacteraceae bacterium]|nr:hypothetical protein [Pelagibacteraceae bacterium]